MNNDLIISFSAAARAASKAQTSAEDLKHVDECYRLRDHSLLDEFEYLCDHVIDSSMERARDLAKNEIPTNQPRLY